MILFLGVEDLLVSRDSINSGVLSVQMFIEKLIEIFSNETSKSRFDEIERRAYVGAIFSLLKQIPGTSVSSECKQRTIGGLVEGQCCCLAPRKNSMGRKQTWEYCLDSKTMPINFTTLLQNFLGWQIQKCIWLAPKICELLMQNFNRHQQIGPKWPSKTPKYPRGPLLYNGAI